MRCCQTGKLHVAKVKDLSNEDFEALTNNDLVSDSSLMYTIKGKPYPVVVVRFKG